MLLHYHTQKQRKIEFKPSLRLNDNHVFVATVLVYHATVFCVATPCSSHKHRMAAKSGCVAEYQRTGT